MKIAFRTDASVQIGTGHVMRCLALADSLRLNGSDCMFICQAHPGHLIDVIRQRGHQAIELSSCKTHHLQTHKSSNSHKEWLGTDWTFDANDTQQALDKELVDWLIVDHYAIDHSWEKVLRPHCRQLMVIDDLADRKHDCDLLLDQNLGRTAEDYKELIPIKTSVLIGPMYALLKLEFSKLRDESLDRRKHIRLENILISMGGVDKDNVTTRLLRALNTCDLPKSCQITVVMGLHAPWLANVESFLERMRWPTRVLVNVNNMAELMTQSDLSIGSSGSTNWERCCLGLPCLLVVIAENQKDTAKALTEAKATRMLDFDSLEESLPGLIKDLSDPMTLKDLSTAAQKITEGKGLLLVTEKLLSLQNNVPQCAGELC